MTNYYKKLKNISGAMDKNKRKMQGCREPSDLTIETYSDPSKEKKPIPLLSQSQSSRTSSKSQSTSRENSEEKYISSSGSTSNMDNTQGATALNVPSEQINFISGNPFVEVTKGILHLFKEK